MKLLILFFPIVVCTATSLSAQANIPKPTYVLQKTAGNTQDTLRRSVELFLYYDNNGNLFELNSNKFLGLGPIPSDRIFYTLNANGKPIQSLTQGWRTSDSSYYVASRDLYGYHTDGQESYRNTEFWNEANNIWVPEEQVSRTYTLSNKTETYTRLLFDQGLQWYGIQNTYTYDDNDRVLEELSKKWVNDHWVNSMLTTYAYNGPDEDYDTSNTSTWNNIASDWYPVDVRDTQIVTNNMRIILTERLINQVWIPRKKFTHHYNGNSQEIDWILENWSISTSAYIPEQKYEYDYNNDQSIKQLRGYNWNSQTSTLFNFLVNDYEYGSFPVAVQSPFFQPLVTISPNPTFDFLQVEVAGNESSKLTLFDLQGRVVARTIMDSNTAKFSLFSQPANTYFLQVEQGGATKVVPVIKN